MRAFGIIAVCAGLAAMPSAAQAQDPVGEQITSSPKGLIGLGLIGAELGLVIPAVAGLDDTWALITFPVVGAAGGALAGHFLIDNNDKPKVGVAMLVTGLALVVPAVVLTLAVTAYDPDDDAVEGNAEDEPDDSAVDEGDDGTVTEPPTEVQTETAELERNRIARAGGGLLRVGEAGVMVGVPELSLVPTYSPEELSLFGGSQATEYRLALVSGSF